MPSSNKYSPKSIGMVPFGSASALYCGIPIGVLKLQPPPSEITIPFFFLIKNRNDFWFLKM